jgi:DNA-binding PadR family transcriptional regulator
MYDNNNPPGGHGGYGDRRGGRQHEWQPGGAEAPHPEFGGPGEGRGRRGGERRGGRDRARRGDARYIVLDALRDGPKHGYEIIKALEERSAGKYVPSPGTVYPTLQYLADQGFVRAQEDAERRTYALTEAGQAELDALAPQVTAFWQRFAGHGLATGTQHEVRFLEDELAHLNHIVWGGLREALAQDRQETIRQVRGAVEECQNKVRAIIAGEQAV